MGNSLLRDLNCLGQNQTKTRKDNLGVRRKRPEATACEGGVPGQDGRNGDCPSTSNQENEDGSDSEEVCYTVLSHVPPRRPSLHSTDDGYENVLSTTGSSRPRRKEPETEYAFLRPPDGSASGARTSDVRPSSCTPENDYELVLPE